MARRLADGIADVAGSAGRLIGPLRAFFDAGRCLTENLPEDVHQAAAMAALAELLLQLAENIAQAAITRLGT